MRGLSFVCAALAAANASAEETTTSDNAYIVAPEYAGPGYISAPMYAEPRYIE